MRAVLLELDRPLPGTVTAALAALAVGCGGGGHASSGGPADAAQDVTVDAWAGPDGGEGDDGGGVTAIDAEAGPPVVYPRVYVVNASPDAPPLRFCLGLGAPASDRSTLVAGGLSASPDLAAPGFALPGLYPGFGGVLDDHDLDLDTLTVDVFALDATNPNLAADSADGGPDGGLEVPCEGLIGGDGLGAASDAGGVLTRGRDYFLVGTIPMGQLGHGTTWLAAVTGCMPGETQAKTLCPPGYDPNAGNLKLLTWQLDSTTVVDGGLGAQVAQASSEWGNVSGALSAGFLFPGDGGGAEGGLPGTPVPIVADAGFGALQPATLAVVPGVTFDGATSFFAQVGGTSAAWPLPGVQGLTWPGGVPEAGVLRDGAGFVFVLVGDPAQTSEYVNAADGGAATGPDAGVFNGHTTHFLAFPVASTD